MRRLLDADMVAGMVADLREWPNVFSGDDEQTLAVGPFITFYFLFDTSKTQDTIVKLIEVHEAFDKLAGSPYVMLSDPATERPLPANSGALPDLRAYAKKLKADDYFIMKASSDESLRSSSVFGLHIHKARAHMNDAADFLDKRFSFIKFHYRWKWWLENKEAWRGLVHETNEKLNPYAAYSGFAVTNPVEMGARPDAAVWERALAPYFYGLDIDYPIAMNQLGFGIRTPTWGFFLSDELRERLQIARTAVRDSLADARIRIDEQTSGQWIELGDIPSLFPVEDGVPDLPALLNRLLHPVRDDHMGVLGFGEWDDDPNRRFNPDELARWMQRFNQGGDWPSEQDRNTKLDDGVDQ